MLRKSAVLIILAGLLAVLALGSPSGCTTGKKDIVDTLKADGRFETLVSTLETADLVDTLKGPGPFTLFAPTDDAFNNLPAGALQVLLNDIPALQTVLLYHVVTGKLMAADITEVGSLTTVSGEPVTISVSDDTVMVNNAKVIEADVECSNGVIHVIDKVLLPPEDLKDIADTAIADGRFTTLVAAMQAAGQDDTLKGTGPYTLFAPTDNAFAALPPGTVETLLNDITTLQDILLYHLVSGKLMAADIIKLTSATTVSGKSLTIAVTDNAIMVNNAKIIEADIECSNGVIHVIDTVLMPPGSDSVG